VSANTSTPEATASAISSEGESDPSEYREWEWRSMRLDGTAPCYVSDWWRD
jgi:hypothetical protein